MSCFVWRAVLAFSLVLGCVGARSKAVAEDEVKLSTICIANVDGSGLQVIHDEEGRFYGSPSWSHDDRTITYDSWQGRESNYSNSEVFTSAPDGSNPESLGRGAMPDWSMDDERIGYHAYDSAFAVNIVSRDGSVGQVVSESGGSVRWRPKRKQVSFGKSGNISLFDEASGEERFLLSSPHSAYYGFTWSPDGKRIAYPTRVGGRWPNAIAIAEIQEEQPSGKVEIRHKASEYFISVDWSPDGKQLLVSLRETPKSPYQLHLLEVGTQAPPKRLVWQDSNRDNTSANWSHDGKRIVFISKAATQQQ